LVKAGGKVTPGRRRVRGSAADAVIGSRKIIEHASEGAGLAALPPTVIGSRKIIEHASEAGGYRRVEGEAFHPTI
jgi:hypothetical protein